MNKRMISSLLYAPILYSGIGYWMYSNPSMQSQNILPIEKARSIVPVQRQFTDIFIITPGTIYLVLFVIAVLAKIDYHTKWSDKNIFHNSILKKNFAKLKEIQCEDKIPKFCAALGQDDKTFLLKQEKDQESFGINRITDC